MNTNTKKSGGLDFIKGPRDGALFLLIVGSGLWQLGVAAVGGFLYFLLVKILRLAWWQALGLGIVTGSIGLYLMQYRPYGAFDLHALISNGFYLNIMTLKHMFIEGPMAGFDYFYGQSGLDYIVYFSLLFMGLWSVISLIPNSAHEQALKALDKAKVIDSVEKSAKQLDSTLRRLDDATYDGTLLGVSKKSGNVVWLKDDVVNQVVLVLGTTGAGKTVTLRRFYQRAAAKGYPLIVVDGKPTDENVRWLEQLAANQGRSFYGFNCGNYFNYDALAKGGFTELKDKVITLKSEWSSDHYKSIAGDYLQTAFEVLLRLERPFDLKTVVKCLKYEELALLVRQTKDKELMDRVASLKNSYKEEDITGLRAHLSTLVYSELGHYFTHGERTFNLPQAIAEDAIVYFALPALRFPDFAKVLGKLVINDIKAVIDRQDKSKRIFALFDEFSVFAGEQVLNLVNMGRGKGMHAVFGTQGLADLKVISPAFESQVLNCANTLICHRLNDQESAEKVAAWAGTKDAFDVTAQISQGQGGTGMGTVRRNKAFIVHPDEIKQSLQPGEAYFMTKVGKFQWDKIKVKYS